MARIGHEPQSGAIVALGGTDLATGLPFVGKLMAPAGSTVVTPLTTLVAALGGDTQDATGKGLSAFGLSSTVDLTTLDPVAATQSGLGLDYVARTSERLAGDYVVPHPHGHRRS